jgi:hypothetical protein
MNGKFLTSVPDPFTDAERAAFARRVRAGLPARRRAAWGPALATAAAALMAVGAVFVALGRAPQPAEAPRVAVENPLRLAGAGPLPAAPAVFPAPPAPPVPPAAVEVPFAIAKANDRVMLTWEGAEGTRYLVQKCLLSANGKQCRTEAVVTGNRFEDRARDEGPLVLYTVGALRS